MTDIEEVIASGYHHTFSRSHPILSRIKPGVKLRTKTVDSSGHDFKGNRPSGTGNPLTGPFYIEGAESGDSISVHLSKVRCNRDWGYSSYRLGLVALTPESVEHVYPKEYKTGLVNVEELKERADLMPWDINLQRSTVKARKPQGEDFSLEFPIQPMLGCIGVAPAGDFTPTSGPSGSYGGNIDYNEIREKSIVHLPVYHEGAYLYVGDGHALQGDGEPLGSGVETSMDVEFSVTLNKGHGLEGVRVETDDHIISVGSQPEFSSSMNRGLQLATSDMVDWLMSEHDWDDWAAHMLIGMVGVYDVVTVAGSMALKIPKTNL